MKIPEQVEGNCSDTFRTVDFETGEEARAHFETVKSRLYLVNSWYSVCGGKFSKFRLCSPEGNDKKDCPKQGDTIQIFTGTENEDGDGKDWVRIEKIIDDTEELSFTVRPCSAPTNDSDKTAHFYEDDATNTFSVKLKDKSVVTSIRGRNEKINTDSDTLLNTIRNTAVALGGIIFGSKAQWEALADGLIKTEQKNGK